nr:uncharacterized protein LOC112028903 [Quercus suber]POF04411.1 hypothetical protein CFP56_32025 [Quercus suber]
MSTSTTTPCCHTLSPPNSRVRVLKKNPNPRLIQFSFNPTLPRLNAKPYISPTNKWRFLCLRDEESSSAIPESKFVEDKLSEELVKPEFNQINDVQKDWISRPRKVTDALFGA